MLSKCSLGLIKGALMSCECSPSSFRKCWIFTLVSGESHFLLAGFLTLFLQKNWQKGLHFVAHRCVVISGHHCFQGKDTAMCKARLALCLLNFGYVPEICSWEMSIMGTSKEVVIQHFYAVVTQPCSHPHLPTTLLHLYTGMHVHCISKGVEDKIPFRSYLAVCARNREGEESLVFSSSNSNKYTGHS